MKTYINSLLFALLALASVRADLPIHCLKSQVEGKWTFQLEEKVKGLNPLENHCGHSMPDDEKTSYLSKKDTFAPVSTLTLHLLPDGTVSANKLTAMLRMKQQTALLDGPALKDQFAEMKKQAEVQKHQRLRKEDQEGFSALLKKVSPQNRFYDNSWTMIYDEGFEVTYEHQKIFVFSQYYPDPKNSSVMLSNCSASIVGWYHNYLTDEYTCIRGARDGGANKQTRFSQTETETESKGPFLPGDFKEHQMMAERLNSLGLSWTSGVSEDFQGLTVDEMHSLAGRKSSLREFQRYSFKTTQQGYLKAVSEDVSDLPSDFSWEHAMGKVKNQGKCGSCYIFAFLEMLHTRLRILHGDETELSYQHAMDCMYFNQGCQGGFPTLVAKFGNEVGFIP